MDVTATATWVSGAPSIARVSSSGMLSGVATGQANVTASAAGASGSLMVAVAPAVSPKTLTSLSVSPQNLTMYAGTNQQFQALGVYSDATTADVSGSVTWASSNTADALVSSKGSVQAITAGGTTITASIGSVNASAQLNVDAATSGFTYVNDLTDSRLLSYQVGGGAKVDFFGSRDSNGDPSSITGFRSTAADGSWEQYTLDSQGRPVQAAISDGSIFGFTWTGTSNGTLTGVSADRLSAKSVAISVSSSGTTLKPEMRTSLLPKTLSFPGQILPTLETVRVTSCKGKFAEDGAAVTVTRVATFGGDPIPATWAGPGTGTFSADIGSGPVTVSSSTLTAAKNALNASCSFLSNGQPQGNPALSLSPATCVAFSEFPPLAATCAVLGYGLIALDYACKAQSAWDGLNSSIDYVDNHQPLVSVNVTATLNGQSLLQTLTGVPQAGPVPSVAIDFPFVTVDHVNVTPATTTVPIKGTETLTALPFDSANKVLQSSGFNWHWDASPPAVASVVQGSTSSSDGFVLPFGVVTGISGGTASVTATETTTPKTGFSSVTVSTVNKATREFNISGATNDNDVMINGVDLGVQKIIPPGGYLSVNVCSVPDGATAHVVATMNTKSPAAQPTYPMITAFGFDPKSGTSYPFSIVEDFVALTCDSPGSCVYVQDSTCVTVPGLSQ